MASIKIKFRPSTVEGKDGTLFFQIIHLRQVKQLNTGLHVYNSEWDAEDTDVIVPAEATAERVKYLSSIKENLRVWQKKLLYVISELDSKGDSYTADDVILAYNTPGVIVGLVSFTRKLIEDLKKIGKKSIVKRFEAVLNSFLR